jgi:hypothetical protein
MTALWASVAGSAAEPAEGVPACADAPAAASGPAPGDDCEAWWTADERYVLRVGGAGAERWYVGELDLAAADVEAAVPRPPRETLPPPRSRTMLVGRRRGSRVAPSPMRLHVRRPARG